MLAGCTESSLIGEIPSSPLEIIFLRVLSERIIIGSPFLNDLFLLIEFALLLVSLYEILLDIARNGGVTRKLHRELALTLGARAKFSRVSEHLRERNFSFN